MRFPEFCGGSYQSFAVTADQERTVNFYWEQMESKGATSQSALYPIPGVRKIAASAYAPGRGHFFEPLTRREFVVIGDKFHEVGQFGAFTARGTVAVDANPATISSNGDGGGELFVTAGGNGYLFDLDANTFTQISALNGKATMGDSLDGYFLALDANTATLYASDLLDGTTWQTGTAFAQRNIASDPWVSLKVNGRYVFLLGKETTEVWYDSGRGTFPFEPHPSGLIPYGIAAPFSVSTSEGQITWLGASRKGAGAVLSTRGFAPEVVADQPLQLEFSRYTRLSDAVADSFSINGHLFYLLSFLTANTTWCLDLRTGKWTEWLTWIPEQNEYVAWRPRFHSWAFDQHRMLDAETGAVYHMSSAYNTDVDGREIRRVRRAPALSYENQRLHYAAFELDLEPGLGIPPNQTSDLPFSGLSAEEGEALGLVQGQDYDLAIPTVRQGSDPQVMLRQSRDGGKTWGNERWCSAGKSGDYGKRVRWNRCGSARRMVFEVVMSDPVSWKITAAYLTLGQAVKTGQQPAEQQRGAA